MSKGVKLMAAACCLATGALAQAPSDTLRVFDDNSDFTFTETQLDEDNDASQAISSITSTRSDYFLSEVGYRFSAMRFRVRAYDNMYSKTAMNGILLNDLEGGRFSYGLIGGMNDAVRNEEGVPGFGYNTFALPGLGGATSINTRASQFATGSKLAVSGCNRNYVARDGSPHGQFVGAELRQHLGHVFQFGIVLHRAPLVDALGGVLVVVLPGVVDGVEEVFLVVESHAVEGIAFFVAAIALGL